MKKVFIAFISLALVVAVSSCKKETPNTNSGNGGDVTPSGSQWGGSVTDSVPNTSLAFADSIPFIPGSADIPCVVQNQPYDVTVSFKVPHYVYNTPVGDVIVDSLIYVSMCNLPEGLKWKVNRANGKYAHGEYGALEIYGTTNAAVGQYQLNIWAKAFLAGSTNWEATNNANVAGLGLQLRVSANAGSCAPFSANDPNIHISSCVAGD